MFQLCCMKYNKQKVERFTKKRDNVEQWNPLVRHLSVEKKDPAAAFCAICNHTDYSPENLHACGSFHATKWKVNAKHSKEVTENWKLMALKECNETLLNHLSTGDASSKELHYHAKNVINIFGTYASRLTRRTLTTTLDRNGDGCRHMKEL